MGYVYTMGFYLAVRNNDTWFEGKWMQLEDIMLSEVKSGSERQRLHVFSYMWKIQQKDKYTKISIYKLK
jgi:hypothetical protein